MTLRSILTIPDPRLRAVADPVTAFDAALLKQVEDMFETMYEAPGVGLAATQIGVMNRVVTIDASRDEEEHAPFAMVNPEILWRSEETQIIEEGCLSIPEYYEEVERSARIRVRYHTETGGSVEREAEGFLATVIQHEVDHLNGRLFIDYLSRLKRDRVTKKFQKAAKRAVS
jgi:peptide deformylase